jgi:hypothetical protein
MAEDLGIPEAYNIPADLPGEELNVRIDPVDGYLPARPEAIDTYQQVVGNPITGSNPNTGASGADYFKNAANSVRKEISTPQEGDEYYSMRPYTYSGDYDAANFDRYYGTRQYKALGFSPYRDNESLYNDKMTFGDQFVRSFSQWDNLLANGFKSGVKTWGDIFTDPLAPDLQSAKDMQRSIAIGSINTGGVGGFMGNTALNLMYGMGMGLEFIAEEAALAAATAFSGGLLGEATAPAMLSRGAMFAKNLGKIGELGAKVGGRSAEYAKSFEKGMDAFKTAETAAELTKNIKKTEGAINGVNSARAFYKKAISGAFDLANPFEETFAALKSTQYANNYAKTIGTSGAFIDDILRIKMAAAEAKNEGGMVQIDATKKLIDQYRDENGKDPTGEDLKKIETLARLEAEKTVLYNYPAILATNKLLFATILYPLKKIKGGTTGKLIETAMAEDGVKATSQNIFKKLGSGAGAQMKSAAKSLLKPKVYGTYGMNYLKANVGEGLQENIQEALSQGAIEHALAVQSDPAMAAYQGHMGYIMHGIEDQISAQGAETFASGFLMGMFQQPIMTAPTWALSKGIERLKSKEVRDDIKAKRDFAADNEINTLNNLANNDLRFWYGDAVTTVKNNALNTDMLNQASIGDIKGARDSQFAIEFNHIAAVSEGGRFDTLMEKLKDYRNLTPTEALEAFKRQNIGIETEADAVEALKHIDSVIDRAYSIKDKFEEVASEFPNYFNMSAVKPGTPEYTAMAISYKAWQEAQRNLVFAKSAFDEYAKRTTSLVNDFSSLSSDIAKTDAQALQSVMTLPNLKMEIATLKRELSALGDVEGQGEIKRATQKKLDLFTNFQESIIAAQAKISSENITDHIDKQAVYGQAKKDFQKLLTYLAKKNDTILFNDKADKAFGMLTDNLEMRDQMQGLAQSINVLNSPKGFLNFQSRIFDALDKTSRSEVRIQRIRENIMKFYSLNDENEIMNALGKLGLKLPDEFIEQYKEALDKGAELPTPENYIDPSTGEEVDYLNDGDRYLKADELWQAFKYWMQETRIQSPEELAKEKKNAEAAMAAMQFDEAILDTYPKDLADNLKAMHLTALESGTVAKDQTLKEFVETDPNALQEIKLYKMQMTTQTDWVDLIEKAKDDDALYEVMDKIDALNAMTPDLLTAISKKRDTFKPAVVTAAATYSAVFFNTANLEAKYKPVHPNQYAHHSTIEFKPADITGLPIGEERTIKIIGRLTTDKVDVLIVENPLSKNKFPHITLSTAEGVKPAESNSEIENNQDKIEPLDDTIQGVVGIFKDGKEITEVAPKEKPTKTEEPELTPIEKLEKDYNDSVERDTAFFEQRIKSEKKDSTKRRITRQMIKRLGELEKQYKKDLKALGVVEKRKKTKPVEGPVYTATLTGGRVATFNPETGNWDFMTKTGKLIQDKETIESLAEDLSNQGILIKLWWTNWLNSKQRDNAKEDILNYMYSGRPSEVSSSDLDFDQTIFLMEELAGTKFTPESLEGQLTDVNMNAWTDKDSKSSPDTFMSEEELTTIGLNQDNIVNKVYELIESYPNGITAKNIKEARQTLLSEVNRDEVLRERFINSYGLDPDVVLAKLLRENLMDFGKRKEQDFTDLSIPEKFNIAVDELKNHQILEGTLTMDASTQIVENDKTYDLGEHYVYQVTLDDGRTFPVTSNYNFSSGISVDVYRNKPRIRLALAEFNGKPAVEVRLMEPGHMDERLTYVREKNSKSTKPITSPISQEDLENVDIFYYLDMTLEEMNKNISKNILTVSKIKGYDVIYQNIPYLVTRVEEKTVSLKSIDGKSSTANISDITEIKDGKSIIKNSVDAEVAKINQFVSSSILKTLNDDISLDMALKNIKSNKCI